MSETMYSFWRRIFVELLPDFLMAEPVCYVFGGFLFLTIVACFKRAIK